MKWLFDFEKRNIDYTSLSCGTFLGMAIALLWAISLADDMSFISLYIACILTSLIVSKYFHSKISLKEIEITGWLDISTAPKDGQIITVYDPKPSVLYGADIHKAYWDQKSKRWIACKDGDTDPFDIDPQRWLCKDVNKFFGVNKCRT